MWLPKIPKWLPDFWTGGHHDSLFWILQGALMWAKQDPCPLGLTPNQTLGHICWSLKLCTEHVDSWAETSSDSTSYFRSKSNSKEGVQQNRLKNTRYPLGFQTICRDDITRLSLFVSVAADPRLLHKVIQHQHHYRLVHIRLFVLVEQKERRKFYTLFRMGIGKSEKGGNSPLWSPPPPPPKCMFLVTWLKNIG